MNFSLRKLKKLFSLSSLLILLILAGCETNSVIINDVEEREANEIVVFLASKGISAVKVASSSSPMAGQSNMVLYSIAVTEDKSTEAMSILNQNGLPRKQGTNLLELFAKQGLMSSEKEETIRYQAGLAQQIANTILKIDGVIDANVQLSFPEATAAIGPGAQTATQRVTAAVYVKHQGILDDPNSHLVMKIKRLVAGSVNGLDVNDVTVISDRSRFTDITLSPMAEALTPKAREYVSIWSIIMSKGSAGRFRFLFFTLIFGLIFFALVAAWLFWKLYPVIRKRGGVRQLLKPAPIQTTTDHEEKPPEK